MRQALLRVAELIGLSFEDLRWWGLTYTYLWSIRERLLERYAPATVNQSMSALRGVLRTALDMKLVASGHYEAAAAVPLLDVAPPSRARVLSTRQLERLIAVTKTDAGPKGTRDAALLALIAGAGLKRSELTALRLADVSARTGTLTVGERTVRLQGPERELLRAWIRARGRSHGALFQPVNKGGRIARHAMSGQAVSQVVAGRATKARLRKLNPEDLRRAYVASRP